MSAQNKIRTALKDLYGEGAANAAQIFRSWHYSTQKTGWHVQRFGSSEVWFLGTSVQEALHTIEDAIASQEPYAEEWPPIA